MTDLPKGLPDVFFRRAAVFLLFFLHLINQRARRKEGLKSVCTMIPLSDVLIFDVNVSFSASCIYTSIITQVSRQGKTSSNAARWDLFFCDSLNLIIKQKKYHVISFFD